MEGSREPVLAWRFVNVGRGVAQDEDQAGDPVEVVAKMGAPGKVVIITVYRL